METRRQLMSILGGGAKTYADKVLGYGPIAYWPLWEPSGGVAYDISGNGFHGAYTGVTLGQTGIGDGRTCPFFDGINDKVDIYSAGLNTAFDGQLGTISVWQKVFNVGVWTDGQIRASACIYVGNNDYIRLSAAGTDQKYGFKYVADGDLSSDYPVSSSNTAWWHMAITWDDTGDACIHYLNGVQSGPTDTGFGPWAGVLHSIYTNIGRMTTSNWWYGYIAHVSLFDKVIPGPGIAALAVV